MSRVPIIAGNWKMNRLTGEAVELAGQLVNNVGNISDREVVVCPTFTALAVVYETIKKSKISLGAQNMYIKPSGAFTGEISPAMLKDTGCKYVILGHSERRQYFKESDEFINQKLKSAFENKLIPIVCVGETLSERESGKQNEVVERQVKTCISGLDKSISSQVVLAYEPVWAIGTGKTATTQQAQDMHKFIRDLIKSVYGDAVAGSVRILYGGSVKPDNVDALMAQPDIDGGLIGGASLKADSFTRIVNYK